MEVEPDSRSITILYAGSNRERAEALQDHLHGGEYDCSVIRVESLDDVVREAKRRPLTALVVEHDLPEGTGVRAVDRSLDIHPDLLTVLLADQPSPSLADRAYETGVDEFVSDTGETATHVVGHRVASSLDPDGADDASFGRLARTLASTASDAMVLLDEEGIVRYANPAVEETFGYEPRELVGEPITVLMSDETADRHRAGMQRYLATGERTRDWDDVELTGRHRDGHEVPISVSFSESATDSTRYFAGVIRDVGERRLLEAEHALYRETTQRILRAESFEDGLRTAIEAICSATGWEYGEAWTRAEHGPLERVADPYAASEAAEAFADATSPVSFEGDEGLVGSVWKSRSYRWVRDLTGEASPFDRDAAADRAGLRAALAVPIVSDGAVVAAMLFMHPTPQEPDEAMVDTTRTIAADLGRLLKRLRAESAVREERSLKNRVLETSPVGIAILGTDGTFQYVNERAGEMLGIEDFDGPIRYEDVDAETVAFDGSPVDDEDRPYRRVIERGQEISGRARVEVGGETRWLSVNGAPLRDEDGRVTSAVFSLQDETERQEREHRLRQYEAVVETVGDGVYALDDEGRFVLVNDAYADLLGYERSELVGRRASEFVSERVTAEARGLLDQINDDGADTATLEATLPTADGERVPIEARIALFDLGDGRYGRAGVVRDISRRKRHEARLAQLNEIGQALTTAETAEEVADIVVDGAREALGLSLTAVEYYDESAGRLRAARRTDDLADLVGDDPVFASERDLPWEVFASGDARVVSDVGGETAVEPTGTPLESAIVLPLGIHGVFVAGATTPDAFDDADVQVARILVANALAALDRVDRERALRAQTEALREHNESLERINRLNGVIRSLTRHLTRASTREEIETAVCEELSAASPNVFAWIGAKQSVSGEVRPRAWAGREDGYLDAVTVREDGPADDPTGTAVRTREPAVRNNLQNDPPFEPWQTEALDRNYRSSAAIPLTYRETMYGVLHLYADETDVFDEMEVAVLDELGEMIGYAINAVERKKALVSDAAVELMFELDDRSIPAIRLTADADVAFELESLVEQSDGSVRTFFTVSGADPGTVFEHCEHAPSVEEVSLLTERDEGNRYEALVAGSGFLGTLVSYGAYPTVMTAGPDGGQVTVELPRSGDVQSFIRMFTREYDGAELVRRKTYDRPVQTREEFEANYEERLTERQLEVLRTAYLSGFFEWPREISGQELAAKLGVTQPTVSRHIRNSERKLLDAVFDEE